MRKKEQNKLMELLKMLVIYLNHVLELRLKGMKFIMVLQMLKMKAQFS